MSTSATAPAPVRILDATAYRRAPAVRDLTDAACGPHAMQILVQQAIAAVCAVWKSPVIVYRAPASVPVCDNYDDLQCPVDGTARDARYLTDQLLLRTQASAMIPRALRMIAAADHDDVLVACPGLTYRRDSIDRLHVGEPHQLDLWWIKRGTVTQDDLKEMIEVVAAAILPGAALRLDPAEHPYTLDGLEVHASMTESAGNERWVEILECGLALPKLLHAAGLKAGEYSGLAMGIGLDRVLMQRKGIDDIRVLRSQDPRIARQMLDLDPYLPVSAQPAIQRDLSLAVAATCTAEELGDKVRAVLGDRSNALEEVTVLSQSPWLELSLAARRRLGMSPDQKNVLLRLVIRDLERTLTSLHANELRDQVYAALHEGSVSSWASREML